MFCHGLINGKRQYKPKQIACQGDLYARLQQILFKHARLANILSSQHSKIEGELFIFYMMLVYNEDC